MAGNKRWSQNEIDILKTYYSITSIEEMAEKLPNRSVDAIHKKASDLKIAFSPDDSNLIFAKLEEINQRLIRLEDIALRVNLGKGSWSEKEDLYLINNHEKKTAKEMSKHLNRTPFAIQNRKAFWGLTTKKQKIKRSKEFDERFVNLYKTKELSEIAKTLKISVGSVSRLVTIFKQEGLIKGKKERKKNVENFKKYKGQKFDDVLNLLGIPKTHLRTKLSLSELNVVGGVIIDKKERTSLNKIDVSLENVDEVAKKYHYSKREILRYLQSKENDTERKSN